MLATTTIEFSILWLTHIVEKPVVTGFLDNANNAVNPVSHGFTLVELMVVVVIIGILVAIAIPLYANVTANAVDRATEANHRTLSGAIIQYQAADPNNYLPLATYDFTDYVPGGLAGLEPNNATGTSYVWSGTTLTSTSPSTNATVFTFTPAVITAR